MSVCIHFTWITSDKTRYNDRQDVAMANPDKQKAMAKKLEEGKFALRDWREQLSTLMNM